MADLAIGAVFAHYRIEEVAGRGGMGVVYRATQLGLDRTVALKLIAAELAEDPDFRERFKRESQMAASIEHPHVIPVYEAGESEQRLFISMRYIEGTDLRRMIRGGPLEPGRAVEIICQIAAALDSAHRRGLVHRDVKPANILIAAEEGEHAYLTDFGLTKRTTSAGGLTATGQFVGTADYTAPEQIMGRPTDARTDVYALGCVLFHALTGQTVYQRDSEVAIMYAHLNEPPPRATATAPDLPPELDQVIERAMAKEPGDRYPSAGDLGRAAVAAAAGSASVEPERSVARGAARTGETTAAPEASATQPETAKTTAQLQTPGSEPRESQTTPRTPSPSDRRRRIGRPAALAIAAALALVAVIGVVLGVSGGGGEDGSRPSKTIVSFAARGTVYDLTARGERRIVWERQSEAGLRVSERRDGRTQDLPLPPARDYAGMDLGTDPGGNVVLVYAGCGSRYTCQVYRYRFDTKKSELLRGVSTRRCDENGPSISLGTVSFSRGWRGRGPTATCQGGLYLKLPERPAMRFSGKPGSSDLNDSFVAWAMNKWPYRMRLARVSAPTSKQRRIPPTSGRGPRRSGFLQPVLDSGFLYFVESIADEEFLIARTKASLGRAEIQRYRVRFDQKPPFTVYKGELLYSGERADGRGGSEVITSDKDPVFR